MTVRQSPRCHLVAGDDAHRIFERLEPSSAFLHDRLELQDLALQRQDTGRQALRPQRLDASRSGCPGGLVELILRLCRQRDQQRPAQADTSCVHGVPPSHPRGLELRPSSSAQPATPLERRVHASPDWTCSASFCTGIDCPRNLEGGPTPHHDPRCPHAKSSVRPHSLNQIKRLTRPADAVFTLHVIPHVPAK